MGEFTLGLRLSRVSCCRVPVERADKAMFQAKNAGRAQVVVIPVG